MKLSISYKMILVSVAGVILSCAVILCIGSYMTVNLFNRTLNNEMTSMQTLVTWINEQQEERLWQTIDTLASNPELAETIYTDEVRKVMEFAQISLRRINTDSIASANSELIRVLIVVIICSILVMFMVALVAGIVGKKISSSLQNDSDNDDNDSKKNLNAALSIKSNEMKQLAKVLEDKVLSLVKNIGETDKINEAIQRR